MQLINNQQDLDEVCKQLAKQPVISIDTEFLRRTTYFPILSIIQIVTKEHRIIVDALEPLSLEPIKLILLNANILKILHSPKEDFAIFYYLFKKLPQNIFDTQIAAQVCGFGKHLSYSSLCSSICNIDIDKTHQTSNWLKRPLSSKMLEYAITDAKHLETLYNVLHKIITETKLEGEYNSRIKSSGLLDPGSYVPNFELVWKKVKFKDRSGGFIRKMQALAAYREEYAIENNIPRRHFATDEDLIKICRHLPDDNAALAKLKLNSRYLKKEEYKQKLFMLCIGLKESIVLEGVIPASAEMTPKMKRPVLS